MIFLGSIRQDIGKALAQGLVNDSRFPYAIKKQRMANTKRGDNGA